MSLSTHLADIYPDELEKVLALPEASSQVSHSYEYLHICALIRDLIPGLISPA